MTDKNKNSNKNKNIKSANKKNKGPNTVKSNVKVNDIKGNKPKQQNQKKQIKEVAEQPIVLEGESFMSRYGSEIFVVVSIVITIYIYIMLLTGKRDVFTNVLQGLVGGGIVLFPIFFIIPAKSLVKMHKEGIEFSSTLLISFSGFFIATITMMHTIVGDAIAPNAIYSSESLMSGGVIGFGISTIFVKLLGRGFTIALSTATIAVTMLIIFKKSAIGTVSYLGDSTVGGLDNIKKWRENVKENRTKQEYKQKADEENRTTKEERKLKNIPSQEDYNKNIRKKLEEENSNSDKEMSLLMRNQQEHYKNRHDKLNRIAINKPIVVNVRKNRKKGNRRFFIKYNDKQNKKLEVPTEIFERNKEIIRQNQIKAQQNTSNIQQNGFDDDMSNFYNKFDVKNEENRYTPEELSLLSKKRKIEQAYEEVKDEIISYYTQKVIISDGTLTSEKKDSQVQQLKNEIIQETNLDKKVNIIEQLIQLEKNKNSEKNKSTQSVGISTNSEMFKSEQDSQYSTEYDVFTESEQNSTVVQIMKQAQHSEDIHISTQHPEKQTELDEVEDLDENDLYARSLLIDINNDETNFKTFNETSDYESDDIDDFEQNESSELKAIENFRKLNQNESSIKEDEYYSEQVIEQNTYVQQTENTIVEEQLVSQEQAQPKPNYALKQNIKQVDRTKSYELPAVDFLVKNEMPLKEDDYLFVEETSKKLEETLHSFGVKAKVVEVSRGPTVTRYEVQPGIGVKVSKIANLSDDLALNLAARGIRIQAPIPGKQAVGIEIPNEHNEMVYFSEIIESKNYKNHDSNVAFGIGKDIAGNVVVHDIGKMPHLLIAGATGSGKSVCVNTLIASILYRSKPEEVKLIMIDPKVVELSIYNGIPHLMIPVVTDPKKANAALQWAVVEMEKRFANFANSNVRDLAGYNRKMESEGYPKVPQLVIIIDELADLMMTSGKEVEDGICRLAQKARAAGIHLIVATQRPSVDVITGLIKANIPSRLAFAVSSGTDSRTIIDQVGAEKLLGKGDMLFYPIGSNEPVRVQGAFISDEEVERIVEHLKQFKTTEDNVDLIEEVMSSAKIKEKEEDDEPQDELLNDAMDFFIERDRASASMLQTRFRIGYNRATRIVDTLELSGYIGPQDGAKPRKILISQSDWEAIKEI